MRIDIPYDDEPRRIRPRDRDVAAPSRSPERTLPEIPLSPVARRLESLREQADNRKEVEISHNEREPRVGPERDAEARRREPEQRPRRIREGIAVNIGGIRLRPQEKTLLAEAGRFRVLAVKDIEQTIYGGDREAMASDLRFLRDRGLISIDSVAARNDGRWNRPERMEVVTLTTHGERLARHSGQFSPDQKLYHGLVKPREVEHDSQIYRAFRKEWEKIEHNGGRNPRVLLDFELKSRVQKAIYQARKQEPKRDIDQIKERVASENNLPFVDHQIQIPDARIEYDLDQGNRTGSSDIEVVTAAYRPGHLQSKVQAGFHLYASASDRSSISARAEGEHHTVDWILD